MKGALLMCLALVWPMAGAAQGVTEARYLDPTDRYPHGVLGDRIEWGGLEMTLTDGSKRRIKLPVEQVFEDLEPRLADVDLDGDLEVVVVESHASFGARLAIFDENGFVAATPNIGTRFRWLAPVAIADLDGDGAVEIAFVDRPHLAKTLRVWRFSDGGLVQIASLGGLTNHRIGEDFISGGLRDCGDGPEMIVASGDWASLIAVRFDGEGLNAETIGAFAGQASFAQALACG